MSNVKPLKRPSESKATGLGIGTKPEHLTQPSTHVDDTGAPEAKELIAAKGDLLKFLQALFHNHVPKKANNEHVMFAIKAASGGGWRPVDRTAFLAAFTKNPAQACYINTATVRMGVDFHNPSQPALRHGNKHFHAAHFLVLDDVKKDSINKLPPAFHHPTTIVETSPNNYQLGYRFHEPITDLPLVQQAVSAIYAAGGEYGWDTGGALPVKFVRLPLGVNGKRDKDGKVIKGKTWHRVNLVAAYPDNEVDLPALAAAVGYDMATPQAQAQRALGRLRQEEGNTTANASGFVDPLLEKLDQLGEVIGPTSGGIYMAVQCPWAHEHSDPRAIEAGFKPLGTYGIYGDEKSLTQRHFKCFHSHCQTRTTKDYISAVKKKHGRALPEDYKVSDATAVLATEWVFVAHTSLTSGQSGAYISLATGEAWTPAQFRGYYTEKIPGSNTLIGNAFHSSPLRLRFRKTEFRPDLADQMVFIDEDGQRVLNTFRRPALLDVPYDPAFMAPWVKFHQRIWGEWSDTVLDNWAYKYRNPGHTGFAELNINQNHRSGRTSLTETYLDLWMPEYVSRIPMNRFKMDWDDHRGKLIVVLNELGTEPKDKVAISEKIKDLVDTTAGQRADLNIKGKSITDAARIFTSWKMFSNHLRPLFLDESDKRIFAHQTNAVQQTPEERTAFWEGHWKSEGRLFARTQLHHFLMARDLTDFDPFADAPASPARVLMITNTSTIGEVVDAILAAWPKHAKAKGISVGQLLTALRRAKPADGIFNRHGTAWPSNWMKQAKARLEERTLNLAGNRRVYGGKDGRQYVDIGRSRPLDEDGNPKGNIKDYGKKQNILIIRSQVDAELPSHSTEVDWDALKEVTEDALIAAQGDIDEGD